MRRPRRPRGDDLRALLRPGDAAAAWPSTPSRSPRSSSRGSTWSSSPAGRTRRRARRRAGSRSSPPPAIGLTRRTTRAAESVTVRGPGGALAAAPAEARAVPGARSTWIERDTRPGEPILLAPQLTALYTLSGRDRPAAAALAAPGRACRRQRDERGAIAALERGGVRLVVIDRRRSPSTATTSFGESFDRELAGWLRARLQTACATAVRAATGGHARSMSGRGGTS